MGFKPPLRFSPVLLLWVEVKVKSYPLLEYWSSYRREVVQCPWLSGCELLRWMRLGAPHRRQRASGRSPFRTFRDPCFDRPRAEPRMEDHLPCIRSSLLFYERIMNQRMINQRVNNKERLCK